MYDLQKSIYIFLNSILVLLSIKTFPIIKRRQTAKWKWKLISMQQRWKEIYKGNGSKCMFVCCINPFCLLQFFAARQFLWRNESYIIIIIRLYMKLLWHLYCISYAINLKAIQIFFNFSSPRPFAETLKICLVLLKGLLC